MSNIDEEKLKEAKAKLACHIEPPKGSAYAKMLAEQEQKSEESQAKTVRSSAESSCAVSSCGTSDLPSAGEKIRLTEMTSAGG